MTPPAWTPREQRIITRCRTPERVQRWLRSLRYNMELAGRTLRSFRGVVRTGEAHCLEGALATAVILEHHGFPPLLLDLESDDRLDHVVFAFQRDEKWGAVGISRDVGLWGRRPVYASPRALAMSYYAPYVDLTARLSGYALADLRELPRYDWRRATRNVWRVERWLIEMAHRPLRTDDGRHRRMRERYRRFIRTHPLSGTPFTRGRRHWM